MAEPATYVFKQRVTQIYEKETILEAHIINKGTPEQGVETKVQKLGWVIVIGTTGYLLPEKPDYKIGQAVEIVIRPGKEDEEGK